MNLQHKVRIYYAQSDGVKRQIIQSGIRHLPQRLLKALFGELTEVLVLTPGQTVQSVEIREVRQEAR